LKAIAGSTSLKCDQPWRIRYVVETHMIYAIGITENKKENKKGIK